MKKVFSILVALALVLGLSIVATPVAADVTPADVVVGNPIVNEVSEYTITFNITASLAAGQTLSIEFPSNTGVPGTYPGGAVEVNGKGVAAGDISGASRVVTIYLAESIVVPAEEGSKKVEVLFKADAGIRNPTTPKEYNLRVRTSRETNWVTSKKYGIDLAPYSTYEFLYARPALISKDFPAEVEVTLKTKVLGNKGYDKAWIEFELDGEPQPGMVSFDVKYGETWSGPAGTGRYPHDAGTFDLKPDANLKIHLKLEFSAVGVYTLSVKLMAETETDSQLEVEVDTPAFTCAGVSETVELKKGWNLISLPIIPVNSDITVVLADIIEEHGVKVRSVWYYNLSITDPTKRWQSYVPGGPTPTLTKIEDGKAYWIDMKEGAGFTFAGVAITLPGQVPPSYSVREGWNMIGFKSRDPMSVKEYLAGTDAVRVLKFENGEWESLRVDDLEAKMEPTLGYWVAFSESGIIYP